MNMVKKVMKAKETGLKDGEQILSAISVNDDGAIMRAAVGGGVGGLLGMFAASKMQKKADAKAEAAGLKSSKMSANVPKGQAFIAVSDTRILFYSFAQVSGNAKELIGEAEKGSIKIEDVEKGKVASRVTFTFSDGGRRAFDVPRLNDIDAFRATL